MRVGFILECSLQGPDASIYPYLAEKVFCKNLQVVKAKTLGDKKNLLNEGPSVAQTLLADGCDYVFIIWDRNPPWDGTGKCKDDKNRLVNDLLQLGVNTDQIILCCIDEMLESWMIVDGRFITSYFQRLTTHTIKDFGDNKDAASQANPKYRIKKYNGKYNDYTDNFKIVKLIDDFTMHARWNSSFRFFKENVERICLAK